MSAVGDFIGDTVGGITGAKQAGEAGERAGELQAAAAREGIAENRRQFDKLVDLMAPFVGAGEKSLGGQLDLLGLNGSGAQTAALESLKGSPLFADLITQGENSILANASATGGLRGGNVQTSLAKFRPQVLSQLIESQFSKLGGITGMGQAAAAGQASAGMESANAIGQLLAQRGAAEAGGAIAGGSIAGRTFQNLLQLGSLASGAKMAGVF